MKKLKRVVEMYIGTGTDYGTWSTEYVEIPRDTFSEEIERVASEQARIDFRKFDDYMFSGVYSIPTIEESDEIMEYAVLAVEEGEEFQEYVYITGLPVPAHTEIGIEFVNDEGEDEVILFPGIYFANN